MRKSRAPSQQFPLVPKEDIGKSYFYIFFFIYYYAFKFLNFNCFILLWIKIILYTFNPILNSIITFFSFVLCDELKTIYVNYSSIIILKFIIYKF
jgi:hypothetical protein